MSSPEDWSSDSGKKYLAHLPSSMVDLCFFQNNGGN